MKCVKICVYVRKQTSKDMLTRAHAQVLFLVLHIKKLIPAETDIKCANKLISQFYSNNKSLKKKTSLYLKF